MEIPLSEAPGVTENYVLGAVSTLQACEVRPRDSPSAEITGCSDPAPWRLHELDITIEAPSAVEASPVVKDPLSAVPKP